MIINSQSHFQQLFSNPQFNQLLKYNIQSIIHNTNHSKFQIHNQTFHTSSLISQISSTLQTLIKINLNQIIRQQFQSFFDQILLIKQDQSTLNNSVQNYHKTNTHKFNILEKQISQFKNFKNKIDIKSYTQKIQYQHKSKLIIRKGQQNQSIKMTPINDIIKKGQQIGIVKQQMKSIRAEFQQIKRQIGEDPRQNKLYQQLAINMKIKIEEINQKLRKNLNPDPKNSQISNNQKTEKMIKRIIQSKLIVIQQSIDQNKKFATLYQQQFSQLQKNIKNQLQGSLESVWKIITDIKLRMEQNICNSQQIMKKVQLNSESQYNLF